MINAIKGYKMILNNHFTPVWEIIENFRLHLAKEKKAKVNDLEIAKMLGLNRATMAQHKHDNSTIFLSYLSIYCIRNNIDIRQFCKHSNSTVLSHH